MPLVAWSNGGFFGEKKGIEWGLTGESFQRTVWLIDLFGFVRTVVEDQDEWGYNSPINLLWYLFQLTVIHIFLNNHHGIRVIMVFVFWGSDEVVP